jgi:hypothetical protein
MLLSASRAVTSTKERKAQPLPIPLFSGSTATGLCLPRGMGVGARMSEAKSTTSESVAFCNSLVGNQP